MILLIMIIAMPVLFWPVANLIAWAYNRTYTRRHPVSYWNVPEAFNWRIFLGPKAYYDWWETRI